MQTYVKPNLVFSKISFMLGGGGPKIKVAQNGVKHGLVLEFWRSDEIFEIWGEGKYDKNVFVFILSPNMKEFFILNHPMKFSKFGPKS